MKKKSLMLFIVLFGFISLQAQENSLNDYFFNGSTAFYSLSKFSNNNNIVIYDKENKISPTNLEYENISGSLKQKIKIVHSVPKSNNYLLVGDYIIDDRLAVISFANSTKKNI